jgi:hypothetical protein
VPLTPVSLHVLKPGERADEILAGLAARLHVDRLEPDSNQHLLIRIEMGGPAAWDLVVSSLDEVDADWRELIWVGQRQQR